MRRVAWGALPVLLFALLVTPVVVTSSVFAHVVGDQEHRLLQGHTDEGVSFLTSTMAPFVNELTLADHLVEAGTPPARAASLASSQLPVTYVADVTSLDPARFDLAARSGRTNAVATGMDGNALVMVLATARGVYTCGFPTDPKVPVKTDIFRDLDGMVYASSSADPAQLMFIAGTTPLRGDVVERQVTVGADKWLVRVAEHNHLVSDESHRMPWIILLAGVLGALLFDAFLVMMIRRHAWANRLVEDRTHQLRAAREAAEVANRTKSEFLSRMSHELRTPLNAVLGFAQLLEMDDLPVEQRDSVQQILRGGRHLLDLINEVLEITRIETGDLALSPEPVAVEEVVGEVLALVGPLAAGAGVAVTHEPASGVHVLADRQRLKQVLLNLVSNAVKYNHAGGNIVIRCEGDEGIRRIAVQDTGIGIAEADLDRLFTPFDRLGAEQLGIEGTGIGLSLSKRLTEAMGGVLSVTTIKGTGSTFAIDLPGVESPLAEFERSPVPATAVRPATTHSVLYIEDNSSNLRLVERVFERVGGIERIASMQGRLGIELAVQHRPSVILLDLHLPDMPGEEVLRELRHDPRTADLPVIVLSADATAGAVERLMAAGATGYLAKPLDVSELLRVLDEHTLVSS